jgi:hypothetical protein
VRHRSADGFVILPAAFSDGKLSREAWRVVKGCLSDVRTVKHPAGFRVNAVRPDGTKWESIRSEAEIPICATWVEVWRAIHRVHGVGLLREGRTAQGDLPELGVSVEPVAAPARVSGRSAR